MFDGDLTELGIDSPQFGRYSLGSYIGIEASWSFWKAAFWKAAILEGGRF